MKDDADIKREIRNMYSRTNMLLRRFGKCSLTVKLCLFRSYCLCLYGTALWSKYNATTLLQLKYCYHKCIKMFFGYAKHGRWNRGAEGAAAPPTFGTGDQAIALAPPKV